MINKPVRTLTLIVATMMLSACQGLKSSPGPVDAQKELERAQQEPKPTAQPAKQELPPSIINDLLAVSAQLPQPEQPRFNVAAVNVDAAEFFQSIVDDTPYSIVLHSDISGKVNLQLKQVTLAETLAIVQQLYGFDIRQLGSVYKVYPAGLRTETIAVNYLMLQRQGFSSVSVNSGGVSQDNNNNRNNSNSRNSSQTQRQGNFSDEEYNRESQSQFGQNDFNGSTVQSESRTNFWRDLEKAIQTILGSGNDRIVVVSPQAGLVTVRGMPEEIAAVKAFLGRSEQQLQRQVVLETKIIEVTLNDEYQQGVEWNRLIASIGSTDFNFTTTGVAPGNALSAVLGGVTAVSFNNADFSGVINLLETQGNTQVLSSPRVTAMNNQKAVIKVGQDEYFVTDVTSNTTVTSGATTSSPNISLQPFFSGIALDVTPQIDDQGNVILHVHPSVTETSEQIKTLRVTGNDEIRLPLAQSNIRESDTIIKARNGEIVVIGGLMQTVTSDSESRTPVLGSIPLLGQLFTSKRQVERKKELVILLKPTVVGPGVWQQQLQQSSNLISDWYPKLQ